MATKMVLRKQTGHICNECKMSFKAKELLIEHYEICPATKVVCRPNEMRVKVPVSSNLVKTPQCQVSSELGSLLVNESINIPQQQVRDEGHLQSKEVIETDVATSQKSDNVSENIYPNRVIETDEEVVKLNPGGDEAGVIPENYVLLQDQSGEQVVASLVDVTNVEGFFENDVCAFEVIEEVVDGNPEKVDLLPQTETKNDIKHSNVAYSSECMKKLNKKRRLNSGSSGACEVTSSSSNSNCNNPSVYSLCLAAEMASSMETVQAAKSLLGMSLQQGDVETDDSGNVKMVSILRKKPEPIAQMPLKKDLVINNHPSVGIKRELDHHGPMTSTPALNVISKISFLQSLNNRIIGKETEGADFSALITTPVACDTKVKVEAEGDNVFVQTPTDRKVTRLNFNILKSNSANIGPVGPRLAGERSKSTFLTPNATRAVYPSQVSNQTNVFRARQALPSHLAFGHDASLMPVTNEVEVIAEVVKCETPSFKNNLQGRQYVVQMPTSVSSITITPPLSTQVTEEKKNMYVCGLCNKAFEDCEILKLHVEKHIGMERQNSSKMKNSEDKLSEDESAGDEESEDAHKHLLPGSKHECRECGLQFARLSLLKKHAKSEHGGLKAYVCGVCNKTFAFACGLKLHALTHGAERRYSCQFCGRRFKHASNLQKHVKVVHVNACKCRTVECTCGKRDPSSFKIDHACRICGRVCESSKHLEIHHRSHTGEKPEVCQTCGKSFQHKSNLQKHQLKHSGVRPYKCQHCDRSFYVKHSFIGHLRLHTRDSPYTCETCGKSFISKNGLQVHSILHQDRLPFSCGHCHREFAQLGNLNKHLSLHTGDKPFPCKYCDKKFVDTSALKRHTVIHTRERNYSCPECGKTFLHFSSLRSHMTTHKFEEQERHQCNICNKTFTVKSNYVRHMKQHEEGPPSEAEQIEYLVYMQ